MRSFFFSRSAILWMMTLAVIGGCSGESDAVSGAEGGVALPDGGVSFADVSMVGTDSGSIEARTPGTRESVCRASVLAYCARRNRCRPLIEPDEAACRAYADLCPDYYFDSSDRTVDEVATCIGQFENASCSDIGLTFPRPCARRGTRAKGEGCVYPAQCATGACTGGITTCGACVDAPTIGMPCTGTGVACASGSFCHPVSHLCSSAISYAGEGGACDPRSDPILGCEKDFACVIPDGATTGTCHRPGHEGEMCAVDAFNRSSRCDVGLHCDSGTCQGPPLCGGQVCDPRTLCTIVDGAAMCPPTVALGEKCGPNILCASPNECSPADGGMVCTKQRTGALGDACTPNLTCMTAFVCTNGACAIYPPSSCPAR